MDLTHSNVIHAAKRLASRIAAQNTGRIIRAYPIPRGGVPAAYLAANYCTMEIVDTPAEANVFIDDIIDSGATAERYIAQWQKPVYALYDKREGSAAGKWITFPWERRDGGGKESVQDNVVRLLQYAGEDPMREGLLETPDRFVRAWEKFTEGYKQTPEDVLKVFTDGGEVYDEMVLVKDIPFYSHCEHHLAPFFGTASIAYIPDGKIVGLSKLSRLLQVYARRLQVQERLTAQVADALVQHLNPRGVGVLVRARHLCMESRGVCQQGHHTVTSALRGVLKEDAAARAEFMSLA